MFPLAWRSAREDTYLPPHYQMWLGVGGGGGYTGKYIIIESNCMVFISHDILVDPHIHTFDYRIRIRILLFSSMAFLTPTKNNFFLVFLLITF